MRAWCTRFVAAIVLVGAQFLLMPRTPAQEDRDIRWVAFIHAEETGLPGALEIVKSNGRIRRTLLPTGVISADVGPGEDIYALRESGAPRRPSLVRIDVRDRIPETLAEGGRNAFFYSVSASSRGDVAYQRFVPAQRVRPPEYLRPAVTTLRETLAPVLVPPDEPPGTGGVVADATEDSYHLLFTNDPNQEMAHAEQVNRFVDARSGSEPPPEDGTPTAVRGVEGAFFCGAASCFLQWVEDDTTYLVGEFGSASEAVAFAEALVFIEEVLGEYWQDPAAFRVPQIVVIGPDREERILVKEEDFCECGYTVSDWRPEGDRLLVTYGAEGPFTQLREYTTNATTEAPAVLEESSEVILDAGYGPEGVLALYGGEDAQAGGQLRTLDGTILIEDVRAFDVEGSLLAYVMGDGHVRVRDLDTGRERTIGEGATDVSIGPEAMPEPSPTPTATPAGEVFPVRFAVPIGLGALALLSIGAYLALRRRSAPS
ncbi:MAG: hypothetical protein ACRDH6_04570 [Actinomycetota bacterium]